MLIFFKDLKTFLNKGSAYEKNDMEGINSKNENNNIKGGESP